MLKYQNPSQTLRGVHAKVAELNAKLAGAGVRIVPYIDPRRSGQEHHSQGGPDHTRGHHAGFLDSDHFLGQPAQRLRRGGEHSHGSGGGVFSLLNLTHVSANLLSLGAIDFGILVDGASS